MSKSNPDPARLTGTPTWILTARAAQAQKEHAVVAERAHLKRQRLNEDKEHRAKIAGQMAEALAKILPGVEFHSIKCGTVTKDGYVFRLAGYNKRKDGTPECSIMIGAPSLDLHKRSDAAPRLIWSGSFSGWAGLAYALQDIDQKRQRYENDVKYDEQRRAEWKAREEAEAQAETAPKPELSFEHRMVIMSLRALAIDIEAGNYLNEYQQLIIALMNWIRSLNDRLYGAE